MIRELIHDPVLLGIPSKPAAAEDLETARDLLDTLQAHRETCVGMAANMIGIHSRIIAFDNEGTLAVMLNPEILSASDPYDTEEGCRSPRHQAVPENQSPLAERAVPDPDQNLHRLDRTDYPA